MKFTPLLVTFALLGQVPGDRKEALDLLAKFGGTVRSDPKAPGDPIISVDL